MCGRFEINATPQDLRAHFGALLPPHGWEGFTTFSSYNVAPSVSVPVLRYSKRARENVIDRLIWGFRPQWGKRPWINARSDTLFQSTAFRESAAKRRCLVPATGWYEWQDTGQKRKQPYYLHFDRVFAFAGVWTARKVNGADWEANFAIITTDARGIAEQIHDRMPLVIHPRNYAAWIDPSTENPAAQLSPFDDGRMEAYPVSTLVNDPKNDSPACIDAVDVQRCSS